MAFFPSGEKICPELYFAGGVDNRRMEEVTVLPEPDSPTRATTSLRLIVKEISFSAWVVSVLGYKVNGKEILSPAGCTRGITLMGNFFAGVG